jgi:hypothetical protein
MEIVAHVLRAESPELLLVEERRAAADRMLRDEAAKFRTRLWLFRLAGLLALCMGIYLMLSPVAEVCVCVLVCVCARRPRGGRGGCGGGWGVCVRAHVVGFKCAYAVRFPPCPPPTPQDRGHSVKRAARM